MSHLRSAHKLFLYLMFLCIITLILLSNKGKYSFRFSAPREIHLEPRRKVKSINCISLFNNDETEIDEAHFQMNSNTQKVEKPPVNISEPFTCSDLIEKNGYITSPMTREEEEFPIAFSILMFKHPEQVERLVRAIYRPQNIYCIHVDLKTFHHLFASIERLSSCFPNVFLASQRISVVWGYTVLEPELVCMRDLLKYKWKYFINLTGQEFPLKTNWELVKILKAYNGANDIEGTIRRANRYRWKHIGPPPHNLVPVKGSTHIVVCRGYIEFIINDKRAFDLLQWSRFTPHPEEVFFSTLNHNPFLKVPGAYLGKPETGPDKPFLARFKNWGEKMCYGKRVRSVCVLGVGDLRYLYEGLELFANKFHADYQTLTQDCLEELIYNRTALAPKLQNTFDVERYASLSFVKNCIK